jgi:hypothetical protein
MTLIKLTNYLKTIIMIKNILKLKGATLLSREQQKNINGNGGYKCTIGELEAIYNGNPRGCIIMPSPVPNPTPIILTVD